MCAAFLLLGEHVSDSFSFTHRCAYHASVLMLVGRQLFQANLILMVVTVGCLLPGREYLANLAMALVEMRFHSPQAAAWISGSVVHLEHVLVLRLAVLAGHTADSY